MKSLLILILFALMLCVAACNPREFPGFKQLAKRQEEKTTRETEEAIKRSPIFQEIDRLCTQEIPRPEGFVPVNKYRSLREEKFLGYGYHSNANYSSVKSFYIAYFAQHGWNFTKEGDRQWGYPEIKFRNQKYEVIITDVGQDGEINFVLECVRLERSME